MSVNVYESKRIIVTRLTGPKGTPWIQLNVLNQDDGYDIAQMPFADFIDMVNALADRD